MKLSRVRIENLRSVETLEFRPMSYTSLIGPNNAGKSTTLRAIELILNHETPEIDEWRKGFENKPIIIEAEFEELLDWERKTPGVAAHVFDNKVRIRMTAKITRDKKDKAKVEVSWESFRQDETIEGWPDGTTLKKLPKEYQELATNLKITTKDFQKETGKESLRSAIREKNPEKITKGDAKWSDVSISIPAALQQALPQAQLIPAIRDASEEGQPGNKTSFGLLLDRIILPAITGSDEYRKLLEAVDALQKRLRGHDEEQIETVRKLAKEISDRVSDLIAAKVMLGMDAPDAKKFIGSSTVLQLDDGTLTRIALQGHGLQRALIFAMLEVLATQGAKSPEEAEGTNSRHTILLFEEPELFIHPHLMRRLKETLVKISQRKGWQVIISTHSPFMIDVGDEPRSLVIHRRQDPTKPPEVEQLKDDLFTIAGLDEDRMRLRAVLDFHPTVNEAFFAKHVVLVEGDTEVATLVRQPDLYKLAGLQDGYHKDVTVVSCDGKWTIIPIAQLLKAFKIPFRVIHDRDRKGMSDTDIEKDRAHEFHANKRIADIAGSNNVKVIDDTFEHVLWPQEDAPKTHKDKPYRAWKRVRELCKKNDLNGAPKLLEVVKFAFSKF
jgi:predicted ATP-dependent endonuclease of OLD family